MRQARTFALRTRILVAVATTVALVGCVVGPDYKGPPPVAPEAIARPSFLRAGEDAVITPSTSRWWTALGDPVLDRLEDAALAGSPDIQIAQARLRASRAGLRYRRADRLPTTGAEDLYLRSQGVTSFVDGGVATAAERAIPASEATRSASSLSKTIGLYDIGFDATWELDVFGGQARAIEGAKAGAQAAQANLQDAEVSLVAEVAQVYVELRDLQQRLALARRATDVEAQLLALVRIRRAGGTMSDLDVERHDDQLEITRTALGPLEAESAEQLDRLATLVGQAPGALDAQLAIPQSVPLPPGKVAVGNPAELLRNRPDIRAAERRIMQENALVGERIADMFPKVTLSGDVGFGSANVSSLLQAGGLTYALAPILQWNPFDFGRSRSRIALAEANRDEALASYSRTVLGALQDAETALSRYARQRDYLQGLLRVEASAERAFALTTLRLQGGTASGLDVLQADARRIHAETDAAAARAELTEDFVSLQKSLGLGWEVRS